MVGASDCHKSRLAAKAFQGRVHLDTFSEWHVGVRIAVEEQQGSVDLVGIEERAAVHEQILPCPGITVGHADFAI